MNCECVTEEAHYSKEKKRKYAHNIYPIFFPFKAILLPLLNILMYFRKFCVSLLLQETYSDSIVSYSAKYLCIHRCDNV